MVAWCRCGPSTASACASTGGLMQASDTHVRVGGGCAPPPPVAAPLRSALLPAAPPRMRGLFGGRERPSAPNVFAGVRWSCVRVRADQHVCATKGLLLFLKEDSSENPSHRGA